MADQESYNGEDTDNYPVGMKLTLHTKRLEVAEVDADDPNTTFYWCKNLDDPTERPSPYLSTELDIA